MSGLSNQTRSTLCSSYVWETNSIISLLIVMDCLNKRLLYSLYKS